ncbi:MAG: hypothetical protein CL868_06930 [Cytophagaceae bacterium]|nr:hypothetical protein [Cytophagaceae bacterium]
MKQHCFLLLLIVVPFFYYSCDDALENNRRIEFKGRLVDSQNLPIPDIEVESAGDAKLGFDVTDANGEFNFVSLDIRYGKLKLLVNTHDDQESKYGSYTFINTKNSEQRNDYYIYDVGEIEVAEVAHLDLEIKNISATTDTLRWFLTYPPVDCEISSDANFNDISSLINTCSLNTQYSLSGRETTVDAVDERSVKTAKNKTAIFSYSFNSDGTTEEITIPLNAFENQFSFEY